MRAFEVENAALRRQIDQQALRVRDLDEKLIGINQRRQDAMKRIDDLLAQLEHLDTRMAAQASEASDVRGVGGA